MPDPSIPGGGGGGGSTSQQPEKASSTVPLAMSDETISLEEMQDRMEGILDARLSQSTNRQTQDSVAFTNFLQACLPSLSKEIFYSSSLT